MPRKRNAAVSGDASREVVYAALLGNALVAVTKSVAAGFSGSSAMLTEAIHSFADTANQVLLLIGNKRSRARADASHPFGYGMEIYFWTFVVAVIVLLAGGVASIWEGVRQLRSPEPIAMPGVSLAVLALSLLFEGYSLSVGYRAYRRIARSFGRPGANVNMWKFIRLSKDPNMYESLLEDSAALVGIGFAAAGVVGSAYFGMLQADGIASIAIGLLLVATSVAIARATRSLMAGESVAPLLLRDIKKALQAEDHAAETLDVSTLQLGPRTILVALTVDFDRAGTAAARQKLKSLVDRVKAVDERIAHVLFRFE